MCKEFADISESVRVESMCCVVNVLKDFFKLFRVNFVDGAETLSQQAIELLIRSLFSATIEEHVTQFTLLSWLQLHLHQLVSTLLKVQTRVNGEIDGASQRYQISFGAVNDLCCFRCIFVLVIARIVIRV